jgi:hypothetical protein
MNIVATAKKKFTYQRADGRRKMIVSRERQRYVSKVREDSTFGCYSRVERELNVHRATIRYWFLKRSENQCHESGSCGGRRSGTFEILENPVVQQYMIEFLTAFPNSTSNQIADELSFCFSRNVSRRV